MGGRGRGGAFGLRFDSAVDGRSGGLVVIVMGGGRSSEGRSHTIGAIKKCLKSSTHETKAVNPKSHVSFSSLAWCTDLSRVSNILAASSSTCLLNNEKHPS